MISPQTQVVERFMKYAAVDTQSKWDATTSPSSKGQLLLAQMLEKELQQIGLQDVTLDEHGVLMATLLPSGALEERPVVGFIAHLDTSPDVSGEGVKPRVVSYLGGEVILDKERKYLLTSDEFPELNKMLGQLLIVGNGETLLGADDKAGVAAIVSAMQYLMENPQFIHGKVRIAFTPDEEIGKGTEHFDIQRFGCDWAYTVDGGELGSLECENFNAANAQINILGKGAHPGYANGKMLNASQIAIEIDNLLPPDQRPQYVAEKSGYYHLYHLAGNVENASMAYSIRDFDKIMFDERKWTLQQIVKRLGLKYPDCIKINMVDQYYNMKDVIARKPEIVALAVKAMKQAGVTPIITAARGGTDGAKLSFSGLPCPNIFTGGLNPHSRYEFLPVQSLQKSMETIVNIIRSV
jgi:tripeptide aminopeptidase